MTLKGEEYEGTGPFGPERTSEDPVEGILRQFGELDRCARRIKGDAPVAPEELQRLGEAMADAYLEAYTLGCEADDVAAEGEPWRR